MSLPAEALATMCTGVDSTGATARELTDRMVMADGRGKSCEMGNSRARVHRETCAIAARRSARCPVDQRPNVLRLPGMRRLGTDSSARRGCRRSGRTNGRPVSVQAAQEGRERDGVSGRNGSPRNRDRMRRTLTASRGDGADERAPERGWTPNPCRGTPSWPEERGVGSARPVGQ
jgi:hypothetical protein